MSYTITICQVKDGFRTSASDSDLDGYIAIAGQADACLTANNVDRAVGQMLKILFVRHVATNARDGGAVTSEKAVSGASRSFAEYDRGDTGYLDTLRSLDQYGCVYALTQQGGFMQLRSIGRRPERTSTY